MPYKHIAAHLHKTELACRLHYHQMSFGNHRKRSNSASSCKSLVNISSISNHDRCLAEARHPPRTPSVATPPATPEECMVTARLAMAPESNRESVDARPAGARSILPAPSDLGRALRLDTNCNSAHDQHHGQDYIDVNRLRSLYEAHKDAFWSSIAAKYCAEAYFSPLQLERAFLTQWHTTSSAGSSSPSTPTSNPGLSPELAYSAPVLNPDGKAGFHAINRTPVIHTATTTPSPGRCTVRSLLNEPIP
jgi:hypothetical protein